MDIGQLVERIGHWADRHLPPAKCPLANCLFVHLSVNEMSDDEMSDDEKFVGYFSGHDYIPCTYFH